MDIFEEMLSLKKEGRPCAFAMIVKASGPSPCKEGARILVREDGTHLGTLGGGFLEAEVIQACLMAIQEGTPWTVPFQLSDKEDLLISGGKVLVYIEPVHPEPHLFILGAGHVGRALSRVAKFAGFRVTVVDNSEEYADPQNIPSADETVVHEFDKVFSTLKTDSKTFILIATRGQNHDLEAVKAALDTEAQYIGLLGSRRKKAVLMKTLRDYGFTDDDFSRIIVPAGLPIGPVTPEETAISIMAQIIKQRRKSVSSGMPGTSFSRLAEEEGGA